jgi:hypothetical protein
MASIRPAIATAALALGGCMGFLPGDGAFGVTGSLPASAESCELLLLTEQGAEVPFTRRRIQRQFREDFTVAPNARVYQVGVQCGNTMTKIATVRYGTEVAGGQWVSLGEIAL